MIPSLAEYTLYCIETAGETKLPLLLRSSETVDIPTPLASTKLWPVNAKRLAGEVLLKVPVTW